MAGGVGPAAGGRGPGDRARTRPPCSVASGKPPRRAARGSAGVHAEASGTGRPPARGRLLGHGYGSGSLWLRLGTPDPRGAEQGRAGLQFAHLSLVRSPLYPESAPSLVRPRPPAQPWRGRSASVTLGGHGALGDSHWNPGSRQAPLFRPPAPPQPRDVLPAPARRPRLASCHFRPPGHSLPLPVPRPGGLCSGFSFVLGQALPARSSRPHGPMAGLGCDTLARDSLLHRPSRGRLGVWAQPPLPPMWSPVWVRHPGLSSVRGWLCEARHLVTSCHQRLCLRARGLRSPPLSVPQLPLPPSQLPPARAIRPCRRFTWQVRHGQPASGATCPQHPDRLAGPSQPPGACRPTPVCSPFPFRPRPSQSSLGPGVSFFASLCRVG